MGNALTTYDSDVVAWAQEQAALLRAGRLAELDAEHLAEEIEDVARAEIRDLAKRAAAVVRYLIEIECGIAPGVSREPAISHYRASIARRR